MRAWEMSLRRYSGMVFVSAAIILGGYGIMAVVTPTEESIRAVRPPCTLLMPANDARNAETIR